MKFGSAPVALDPIYHAAAYIARGHLLTALIGLHGEMVGFVVTYANMEPRTSLQRQFSPIKIENLEVCVSA